MVRSVARGQFRVTWSWNELTSTPESYGGEAEDEEDRSEPVRFPLVSHVFRRAVRPPELPASRQETPPLPEVIAPDLATLPSGGATELTAPTVAPEPVAAALEAEPAPPTTTSLGEVAPVAAETAAAGTPPKPPAGASDPRTVLVSLLARMWLLRTSAGTTGAIAAAPPQENPELHPLPSPPTQPTTAPTTLVAPLELAPRDRPPLRLPDIDDRRPLSGLASFLVEVAGAVQPPRPVAVPPTPGPRVQVVLRLIHCRYPIPERPVSRDACRQPRVGR